MGELATPDTNHGHPCCGGAVRIDRASVVSKLKQLSGMCKAGFAGDDAPRAVFRKYLYARRAPICGLWR
ncbi:actin gamma [Pyrenophora tritici-repentis]|nr:actin gamma [Pyrenophora tritici-repentis]KAI2485476.1 actin gamma [Pyrenophora tritici-repentis]